MCDRLGTWEFCIFLLNFTHLAIVSDKMNAVSRVDLTGTKITHFNTHFNCLNDIFVDRKNVYYFYETLSRGVAYGKESHLGCHLRQCRK